MPRPDSVRVTIFNQPYTLVASGEDPGEVEALAVKVDDLMRTIAARAGNIDSTRIAVLACIHLADQLQNVERDLERLRDNVENKARRFSLLLDEAITEPRPQAGGDRPGD